MFPIIGIWDRCESGFSNINPEKMGPNQIIITKEIYQGVKFRIVNPCMPDAINLELNCKK